MKSLGRRKRIWDHHFLQRNSTAYYIFNFNLCIYVCMHEKVKNINFITKSAENLYILIEAIRYLYSILCSY